MCSIIISFFNDFKSSFKSFFLILTWIRFYNLGFESGFCHITGSRTLCLEREIFIIKAFFCYTFVSAIQLMSKIKITSPDPIKFGPDPVQGIQGLQRKSDSKSKIKALIIIGNNVLRYRDQ